MLKQVLLDAILIFKVAKYIIIFFIVIFFPDSIEAYGCKDTVIWVPKWLFIGKSNQLA